jgi:hypothetical protein
MLPTKFQFIWPSGFRGEVFKNRPIRNKNCLWWPCLLMDRNEICILYRGPSIDASYQVSVHLAEGVSEEKIKMWKVNGRQTTDTKWWQKLTLPLARWAKNLTKREKKKKKSKNIDIVFLFLFLYKFYNKNIIYSGIWNNFLFSFS